MSVVIKGFDKPSDCDYCTLQDDGYCNVLLSYINVEHGIDTRCPLTEISGYTLPNGHKVVIGKTENSSEKPNNSTISKMEQVEDEPQTELVRVKYHCINCAENGSYKCSKCDGEMYYKYDKDEPHIVGKHADVIIIDEPQTMVYPQVDGITPSVIVKDEPQTDVYEYHNGEWVKPDCAWK